MAEAPKKILWEENFYKLYLGKIVIFDKDVDGWSPKQAEERRLKHQDKGRKYEIITIHDWGEIDVRDIKTGDIFRKEMAKWYRG